MLARDIVNYIVEERLAEGTRLPPERQMVAETGRARSTLREALRLLETRGVVDIRQGIAGGPVVRHPGAADLGEALTLVFLFEGASILDVIEARQEMEVLAVSRAIRTITAGQMDEMQATIAAQRDAPEIRDAFLAQSRRFHSIVNEASGSSVIRVLNEALQATLHMAIGAVEYSLDRRQRVIAAHQSILDALRAGDLEAACEAMKLHVQELGVYCSEVAGPLARQPMRWLPFGQHGAEPL